MVRCRSVVEYAAIVEESDALATLDSPGAGSSGSAHTTLYALVHSLPVGTVCTDLVGICVFGS